MFAYAPEKLTCVAPSGKTISSVGTNPVIEITPVEVFTAQGLKSILLNIAPLLNSKPFNKAFAWAVAMATPTFLCPLTEVVSKFLMSVIILVILATTRPSVAFIEIGLRLSRVNFPALAELPNSAPFSLVLTKAGSFAIRFPSTDVFIRAKSPSFVL